MKASRGDKSQSVAWRRLLVQFGRGCPLWRETVHVHRGHLIVSRRTSFFLVFDDFVFIDLSPWIPLKILYGVCPYVLGLLYALSGGSLVSGA